MKYNVLVEMDEHANIDLLVKAMSIMESVPHVTGVSLVGVDAAQKETMHKFKINKMVASLESMIRDLKNEIYITFDTAIHYLSQRVAGVPYHALSEDKSVSCYYAQERLYLVRKMFGDFPVYMFIEASGSKDATDKAIKALAKHTFDGYIIADHVDSYKKKEDLKRINLYYLIEAYCEDYFNLENSCQKCPFHLPVAVSLPDGNATICMKPFILWNRENKNEE